jgi:hypothetical protein
MPKRGKSLRKTCISAVFCCTHAHWSQLPPRPVTPPPRPETPPLDAEMTLITPGTPNVASQIADALTPRRLVYRMHQTFHQVIMPASLSFAALFVSSAPPPMFPHLPRPLYNPSQAYVPAPSLEEARDAHLAVKLLLHPVWVKGVPFAPFNGDDLLQHRMEMVQMMLWLFTHPNPGKRLLWKAASLKAALCFEKSTSTAARICKWAHNFMNNPEHCALPLNLYGSGNVSMLEKGDLASKIFCHLQGVGKYVKAENIVWLLDDTKIQEKYGLKQTVSLATAKRWMHLMDYQWKKTPTGEWLACLLMPHTKHVKGQYVNGHERADVVYYRQQSFLPTMAKLELNARIWVDGLHKMENPARAPLSKATIFWYHDESTFYANDRRDVSWVHTSQTAKPKAKSEGVSLMITDFVSADYGWLCSPDGLESAQEVFRAGARRDGYFTNANIVQHAEKAMDILERYYPNDHHVLIFDNASTHTKCADDALSARDMSKKLTQARFQMWGVDVPVVNAAGQQLYDEHCKVRKQQICMRNADLPGGCLQSLYFNPHNGTGRTCVFKGMDKILAKRGINTSALKAECPGLKCVEGGTSCCTRRVLWSQPDFTNVRSVLEDVCDARGFKVIFLPKFHCELNPIEHCWCHAKRLYRLNPPSSLEEDLEQNSLKALEQVPIQTIRK